MADRFPLILNTNANQIQEIASGDTLDLTNNNISNAGVITATSFSGPVVAGAGVSNITAGIGTYTDLRVGGNTTFSEDLVVTGNARVTGILTVGTSSIILNDSTDTIKVGTALTLGHTQGIQYHTQNLHSAGFDVNQINVSGASTIGGNLDANGDLDVDGHTNLDNVSITGVSTIAHTDFSNGIDVTGDVTTTGTFSITSAAPQINLNDSNHNPDYIISNTNGVFFIRSSDGGGTDKIKINTDGHIDITGNLDCESGIDVTGNATVSGNLSVGGVLTYEDVTNVDSVGIVTARKGVRVTADGSASADYISVGAGNDFKIYHTGNHAHLDSDTGHITATANQINLNNADNSQNCAQFIDGSFVKLFYAGNLKLSTEASGVNITGVCTATTFVGALSGNATSSDTIDIANNSSSGTTYYPTFVDNNGSGKTLGLDSGLTYVPSSNILTAGTFSGSGASLTSLNGSNITSGTISVARIGTGTKNTSTFYRGDGTFAAVTAPAITAISNPTNDRIVTSEGGTTVNAEPNLTFNGSKLNVAANDGGTDVNFAVRNTNANGYGAYISGGSGSSRYILRLDDNGQNEKFRFKSDGNMTATGTVDGGGGLIGNSRFFGAGGNSNSTLIKSNASGSVALTLQDSGGTHRLELYGEGTSQGFLTSAWAAWDLRKQVNAELYLRVSGADYTAIHQGNVSGNVGLQNIAVFTSSGTWTKPSGITRIKVYVTGGGGGGGSHNGDDANGGGGAGATAIKIIDVTSVSSVSVTIGSGGGGSSGNSSNGAGNGNASSFGSYCTGGGGEGPNNWGIGGSGGVASGGDLNLRGGYGTSGNIDGYANSEAGGSGGSSFWGGGPNGGTHWGSRGTNGPYGAGGAGAHANTNNNGSDAQPGVVVIEQYKS